VSDSGWLVRGRSKFAWAGLVAAAVGYVARVAVTLTAAFSLVFLVEGVAHATAYGVSPCVSVLGGNNFSCTFEHGINSSGLYIDSEFADAESPFRIICNARIDFQYSDLNGQNYKTDRAPIKNGCTNDLNRTVHPGPVRAGKSCAMLYSNADLVATQCHKVFAANV